MKDKCTWHKYVPIEFKNDNSNFIKARMNDIKGYVCVTGAHGVIESLKDHFLRKIHNSSFLTDARRNSKCLDGFRAGVF